MPYSTNPDPVLSEEEDELAQVANSVASLLEELGVLGNTGEDEYFDEEHEEQPHIDLNESDDIQEIWRKSKDAENRSGNHWSNFSNSSLNSKKNTTDAQKDEEEEDQEDLNDEWIERGTEYEYYLDYLEEYDEIDEELEQVDVDDEEDDEEEEEEKAEDAENVLSKLIGEVSHLIGDMEEKRQTKNQIYFENIGDMVELEASRTKEAEIYRNLMVITEDDAREAMEKAALIDDVKGLLAAFYEEAAREDPGELYVSKSKPVMRRCPSVESIFRQSPFSEVFIYLYPGKKMISKECRLDTTIYQLKAEISRYCNVHQNFLEIKLRHSLLSDKKTLKELGAKAMGIMRLTVDANKRLMPDLELNIPDTSVSPEQINKPDTVRVVTVLTGKPGNETRVERTVTIVHQKTPKPMIGGFINKNSNIAYHDAGTSPENEEGFGREEKLLQESISIMSQQGREEASVISMIKFEEITEEIKMNRACQTFNDLNHGTQTLRHRPTQMERSDYYVSECLDRVIISKQYKTYEELLLEQTNAALIIQLYWRRYQAKRELKRRLDGLIARIEWVEKIRKGKLEQRKKVIEDEMRRQLNPKSLFDLELLYSEIDEWRAKQTAFIKAHRWGAERNAALATIFEMECDLLSKLERIKKNIIVKGSERQMQKRLKKMGLPKRWLGFKNPFFVSFDTAGRKKVRKLHHIHTALLEPVPKTEEGQSRRLQLINGLYKILNYGKNDSLSFCPIANMLLDLCAREMKFMNTKNPSPVILGGIRHRVANTFGCLCQDPIFNEEAKRIDPIPYDTRKLKKDMLQCKACKRQLYKDQFTIIKGTIVSNRCRSCVGLYRTAILRLDLNLYRQMLNDLRREEFEAGVTSSMSYLIDAFDMKVIIEQIWHSQSALSGIDNRYMLRICRWNKHEPWSPWNTVLLTEEEASAHNELNDMESAYQPSFFHKVMVKHATAKIYFGQILAKFAVKLDYRVDAECARLNLKNQKSVWSKGKNSKVFNTMVQTTGN